MTWSGCCDRKPSHKEPKSLATIRLRPQIDRERVSLSPRVRNRDTRRLMQVYLPIAEMSANVFALLGLGGGVGFLSGLFGIGGGFLMTPLLIFFGVPSAVAVATGANQVVASSVSGALAHWRHGNVDLKMGLVLLAGGVVGSFIGVYIFTLVRALGHIDLLVQISYVVFLGGVGAAMLIESMRAWIRSRNPSAPKHKLHEHTWVHGLPLKMRFRRSKLYISAIAPVSIGLFAGIMSAIMGVGGGFVMVPAMIYVLGMPTSMVIGTSLFQIIFVMANVTFLQAYSNQTVDIVLATVLLAGAVVGAQLGTMVSGKLKAEQLRALLGLIVLIVCLRVAWELVVTPPDLFSLESPLP